MFGAWLINEDDWARRLGHSGFRGLLAGGSGLKPMVATLITLSFSSSKSHTMERNLHLDLGIFSYIYNINNHIKHLTFKNINEE